MLNRNGITGVSVIVCTFNRDYILGDCLDSLVNQTADKSLYEVIVVNNNSTDNTQVIAEEYAARNFNFRVVREDRQGLSVARNRGSREAKFEWVSYIDDDARAFSNYVERTLYIIENYHFDCFGGIYYSWYRNTIRPKWIPESFGQSVKYKDKVDILDNGYINGSTCVLKKEALVEIGGFPEDLGMTGNLIAYGEEVYVQNKLVAKGYKVGFDPDLCIEHLVPEYKLSVRWHIRAAYAHGRDSVKIFNNKESVSIVGFAVKLVKVFIKNLWRAIKAVFSIRVYYLQNFILDITRPAASFIGFYFASRKASTKNNIESDL